MFGDLGGQVRAARREMMLLQHIHGFIGCVASCCISLKSQLATKMFLEIWSTPERLITDFCELWMTSWCTDSILSMLLTVRAQLGCCLSATVSSALNLATIKWMQRGEEWFIFPVFLLHDALCVLRNQTIYLKRFINFSN